MRTRVFGPTALPVLLSVAVAVPGQETTRPKFAWPVPCRVTLVKDAKKRGNVVRLRYRLELRKDEADVLRIRQTAFEFLQVNGQDATTPAMRKELAPTLALTEAVPDILVNARGAYLGVEGIDTMVERFVELEKSRGKSAADAERSLQALRSPIVQDQLQQACGKDWQAWVGAWVGFAAEPGKEITGDGGLLLFGETLPAKVTHRHHGAADQHPGHVRLSVTSIVEGEKATRAFAAAMQRIAAQGGGKALAEETLQAIRVEARAEVVTDPATLRPLRAVSTKKMHIVVEGEEPRDEVESSEFTFEWQR